MSEFTPVCANDMRSLFQPVNGWVEKTIGYELVFDYELKARPGIYVRVWSSVSSSGDGRDKGKDAIRVSAFDAWTDKGLRKTPHIKRSEGWQDRVKCRVKEVIQDLRADPVLQFRKPASSPGDK